MYDFTSFKGRQVNTSKKVRVFRNLSPQYKKEVVYSVVQGGKTVGHTRGVTLCDVRFHVSEKGRQYVIKNKKKIVHAYVSGYIQRQALTEPPTVEVRYNPYKYAHFMCEVSPGVSMALAGAYLARVDTNGVRVDHPREL